MQHYVAWLRDCSSTAIWCWPTHTVSICVSAVLLQYDAGLLILSAFVCRQFYCNMMLAYSYSQHVCFSSSTAIWCWFPHTVSICVLAVLLLYDAGLLIQSAFVCQQFYCNMMLVLDLPPVNKTNITVNELISQKVWVIVLDLTPVNKTNITV